VFFVKVTEESGSAPVANNHEWYYQTSTVSVKVNQKPGVGQAGLPLAHGDFTSSFSALVTFLPNPLHAATQSRRQLTANTGLNFWTQGRQLPKTIF